MADISTSISIKTKGINPIEWINKVPQRQHFEFQEFLKDEADKVASSMKRTITDSGYNLETLSDSIQVDILNSTAGIHIGVGKIEDLPIYWEWFNDGFRPGHTNTLVPLGGFSPPPAQPLSGHSGGKWNVGNDGFTFLDNSSKPKKAVEPLKYIESSNTTLNNNIKQELDKIQSL